MSDSGVIVQVSVSRGGLPKRSIGEGFITPLGIEGDLHAHPGIHGGPQQAVLIVASEGVDELRARGYPVFYGALGENLTTRGLTIRDLRIGDQIRAGGALLEITKQDFGASRWRWRCWWRISGALARGSAIRFRSHYRLPGGT